MSSEKRGCFPRNLILTGIFLAAVSFAGSFALDHGLASFLAFYGGVSALAHTNRLVRVDYPYDTAEKIALMGVVWNTLLAPLSLSITATKFVHDLLPESKPLA